MFFACSRPFSNCVRSIYLLGSFFSVGDIPRPAWSCLIGGHYTHMLHPEKYVAVVFIFHK